MTTTFFLVVNFGGIKKFIENISIWDETRNQVQVSEQGLFDFAGLEEKVDWEGGFSKQKKGKRSNTEAVKSGN